VLDRIYNKAEQIKFLPNIIIGRQQNYFIRKMKKKKKLHKRALVIGFCRTETETGKWILGAKIQLSGNRG